MKYLALIIVLVAIVMIGYFFLSAGTIFGPKALRLEEGKWYKYEMTSAGTEAKTEMDIYFTDETDKAWKGILGGRGEDYRGKEAYLFRFKIDKEDLSLLSSYPLKLDEIQEEDVEYFSLKNLSERMVGDEQMMYLPLFIPLFKEMTDLYPPELFEEGSARITGEYGLEGTMTLSGKVKSEFGEAYRVVYDLAQPGEVTLILSTAKPYLLINMSMGEGITDAFTLSLDEIKEFEISDIAGYYSGYEIKTIPKVDLESVPLGPGACVDNITALIGVRNVGIEPISTDQIEVTGSRDGETIEPLDVLWREGAPPDVQWKKSVSLEPGEMTTLRATCTTPGNPVLCKYRLKIGEEILDMSRRCEG